MKKKAARRKTLSVQGVDRKYNILMIMVDQMQFPRFSYGEDFGFKDPIKRILGFQGSAEEENEFKEHYPGFWAMRQNTYMFNNHRIASSACVPSRTALFTGQYGTQTGVLQTDGVFKDGAKKKFCWLEEHTHATTGSWLREAGYDTHYFGKWHITGEETENLEAYGFSSWELSYPDPHGTLPNNLGYFRDYQFEDVVCSFFRRQGLGVPYSVAHAQANVTLDPSDGPSPTDDPAPWFAVASFTNPHDIASYPGLPGSVHSLTDKTAPDYVLPIPQPQESSTLAFGGSMSLTLNKKSFPQDCASPAITWGEPIHLSNKPTCQNEYKYKMGLTLVAKSGRMMAERQYDSGAYNGMSKEEAEAAMLEYATDFVMDTNTVGLPFALTDDPEVASTYFMQYYAYLLSEVDQHIHKALTTLEESSQADDTIVLFCPDHGEYAGAHGTLMEKWHTGYDEVIHVPLIIRVPESWSEGPIGLKQIDALSSHVDVLPTILELAGVDESERDTILSNLQQGDYCDTKAPVGSSLVPLMKGEQETVQNREGVLFITYDTITEGFSEPEPSLPEELKQKPSITNFEVYANAVERLKAGAGTLYPEDAAGLQAGSVAQPNNVHALVTQDGWKLVKYLDSTVEAPAVSVNHFEMYKLYEDDASQAVRTSIDGNEEFNLVNYADGSPIDPTATILPAELMTVLGRTPQDFIAAKFDELNVLMTKLESEML